MRTRGWPLHSLNYIRLYIPTHTDTHSSNCQPNSDFISPPIFLLPYLSDCPSLNNSGLPQLSKPRSTACSQSITDPLYSPRTMRLSLRRVLQWFGIFALLQLVVYYWTIKRPRVLHAKVLPHKFLDSISNEYGTCSFKVSKSDSVDVVTQNTLSNILVVTCVIVNKCPYFVSDSYYFHSALLQLKL